MTLIEATPNRITQVKTVETDGYTAVQVTAGTKRAALVNKPLAGHYAKAKVEARPRPVGVPRRREETRQLRGRRRTEGRRSVQGRPDGRRRRRDSKGKGFQGTIKRWNFTMGDATHGNSLSHRSPGSIGQRQTPGRVFPGKKMAGHMGAVRRRR